MIAAVWRRSARAATFVVAIAGIVLGAGCAGPSGNSGAGTGSAGVGEAGSPSIADPPRRPGRPLVMVAMPDSASFRAVRSALIKELTKDFDIQTQVVGPQTGAAMLGAEIARTAPACLVLMDNPTVRLYREWGAQRPAKAPLPPAVVVMASFLEELRAQLPTVTGVAYEVPAVTAFVNLRSMIERPVKRVGVVHRPAFRRFIERQRALAAKEQIELVAVEVAADPGPSAVRVGLRQLRTSQRIDALWVLNDNGLLRDGAFIESAWRRELAALRVPVIVGVPTLVAAEARFGDFAVVPDLGGVGVQAANMVFELNEADWRAQALPIEHPLSTLTVVNLAEVERKFGLQEGAQQRIDKVIE